MAEKKIEKTNLIKVIVLICMLLIVLLVIILISKRNKNENETPTLNETTNTKIESSANNNVSDVSTGSQIKGTKEYNGLQITDVKIQINGNNSQFSATVKNTSDKKFNQKNVVIICLDKEKNELIRTGYTLLDIKPNEELKIEFAVETNLNNVSEYKIEDMP